MIVGEDPEAVRDAVAVGVTPSFELAERGSSQG